MLQPNPFSRRTLSLNSSETDSLLEIMGALIDETPQQSHTNKTTGAVVSILNLLVLYNSNNKTKLDLQNLISPKPRCAVYTNSNPIINSKGEEVRNNSRHMSATDAIFTVNRTAPPTGWHPEFFTIFDIIPKR